MMRWEAATLIGRSPLPAPTRRGERLMRRASADANADRTERLPTARGQPAEAAPDQPTRDHEGSSRDLAALQPGFD